MAYQDNPINLNARPAMGSNNVNENFTSLNSQFSVNHVSLTGSSSTDGYHTEIFFPGAVSDPNLTAPHSAVFPKEVSGLMQLFFQNGATSQDIEQITGKPTSANNTSGQRWEWDFNFGLKLRMGRLTGVTTGTTVTFTTPLNAVYTAIATRQQDDKGADDFNRMARIRSQVNTSRIVLQRQTDRLPDGQGINLYYLVIGS